jgi:septal ring factor EnvC (AmiA/AmiB activator)
VIAYLALSRNKDKDSRNNASQSAVIQTKLENIDQGVRSIQVDIKANERKTNELSVQIARVEESAKSAHKRLDVLEKKEEKEG